MLGRKQALAGQGHAVAGFQAGTWTGAEQGGLPSPWEDRGPASPVCGTAVSLQGTNVLETEHGVLSVRACSTPTCSLPELVGSPHQPRPGQRDVCGKQLPQSWEAAFLG